MSGLRIVIDAKESERATEKLTKNLEVLGDAAVENEKDFDKLQKRLQDGLKADKASKTIDQLKKSLNLTRLETARFQAQIGDFSGALKTIVGGAKNAATAMAALGAATAALGGVAFKEITQQGMDFEQTMKAVQAVSRASEEDFKKLSEAAKQMGATTEWSAQQSAEALKFMAMAGMSTADSIEALPGLLDLATAAQMDLATAADIATDSMTAFGLEAHEIGRMNDALINTSTRANATVSMLGESFKKVAPVASQMGYDVEQTSAMLGVLANAGTKAEIAGTHLKIAFLKTADAAKDLGLSAGATLIDVLEEMAERQYSVNDMTALFGSEAAATIAILKDQISAYKDLNKELKTNHGATQDVAEVMRDTLKVDLDKLKSAISDVALEFFELYDDDLRKVIQNTTKFITDNKDAFISMGDAILDVARVAATAAKTFGETLTTFMDPENNKRFWGSFFIQVDDPRKETTEETINRLGSSMKQYKEGIDALETSLIELRKAPKVNMGDILFSEWQKDILQNKMKGVETEIRAGEKRIIEGHEEAWEDRLKVEGGFRDLNKDLNDVADNVNKVGGAARATKEELRAMAERKRIIEEFSDARLQATLSQTDYELHQLKEQYKNYDKHVEDKEALDEWYQIKKRKIQQRGIQEDKDSLEKKKKAEEKALEEIRKIEEKELKERQKQYDDFVDDTFKEASDIIYTAFTEGADSAFDVVKDDFNRFLSDLATAALLNPIILPIAQGMADIRTQAMGAAFGTGGVTQGTGVTGAFQNVNAVYSALSGGMEAGVYSALTSGIGTTVGQSIFGAGYLGTASQTAASLGVSMTEASAIVAGGGGAGGIASTIAAAAPWAAMAAIAIPIVLDMLESEPEPFVRVQTGFASELAGRGYQFGVGEGESRAGYRYNITMQDLGGGPRGELSEAVGRLLDSQFSAVEDTLSLSINDAITKVQTEAGEYGKGFFAKIDLRDFQNNIEGALRTLSDDLFIDVRDALVSQMGIDYGLFDQDFFSGIAVEGEQAVDTFLRFGQVVQNSDDFMEEFTRQTELLGNNSIKAYQNIESINAVMASITEAEKAIITTEFQRSLDNQIDSWKQLYEQMVAAGAAQADLNKVYEISNKTIGAAITGFTAEELSQNILSSINTAADAQDFVGTIADQLQDKLQQAIISLTIAPIIEEALSPITTRIGEIMKLPEEEREKELQLAGDLISSPTGQAFFEKFTEQVEYIFDAFGIAFEGNTEEVKENTRAFRNSTTAVRAQSGGEAPTAWEKVTATLPGETIETARVKFEISEVMKTIREEVEDSNLNEFEQQIADIQRQAEDARIGIKAIEELIDKEAELTEIREWESRKIDEITNQWRESAEEYVRSYNNLPDLVNRVSDSFDSAYQNALQFAGSGIEHQFLWDAAVKEALTPAVDALESFFDLSFSETLTKTQIETQRIIEETNTLKAAFLSLETQFKGLDGFDKNSELAQFFQDVPAFIDSLAAIQAIQLERENLLTIGGAKAQVAGLSQEWEMMNIGQRWGGADLTTFGAQRTALANIMQLTPAQIAAKADELGVSVDIIASDMIALGNAVNPVIEQFKSMAEQLEDTRQALILSEDSPLDPRMKYEIAKTAMLETFERVKSADPEVALKAMGELQGVTDAFMSASEAYQVDPFALEDDFGTVARILKDSQVIAEDQADLGMDEKDISKAQLEQLKDTSDQIGGINATISNFFGGTTFKEFSENFSKYLTFMQTDYSTSLKSLISDFEYGFGGDIDASRSFPIDVPAYTFRGEAFETSKEEIVVRTSLEGDVAIDIPSRGHTISEGHVKYTEQPHEPKMIGVADYLQQKYGVEQDLSGPEGKGLADWYKTEATSTAIDTYAKALGVVRHELERDLESLASIHGYKDGGMHNDGYLIAGEIGPEMMKSGGARFHSTEQTVDIFARSNKGTEDELNRLNNKIDEALETLLRIRLASESSSDTLDEFNEVGMPAERATA